MSQLAIKKGTHSSSYKLVPVTVNSSSRVKGEETTPRFETSVKYFVSTAVTLLVFLHTLTRNHK